MSTTAQAPWKKAEMREVADYLRDPRGFTQSKRPMKLKTSLGEDVLLLVEFSGREALSELFEYKLVAVSPREVAIRIHELLGHAITVEAPLTPDDRSAEKGEIRYFHGIVGAIECVDRDATFATYHLTLVPSLWPLQENQVCRIFQDQTVRQILETVLPSRHIRFELHETYRPRNYTTQYLESDFDFAARLMEENGIYYYFDCTADNDVMVIADRSILGPEIVPSQTRPGLDIGPSRLASGPEIGPSRLASGPELGPSRLASGPELGPDSTLDFDPVGGGTRNRWRVRDWKTGLTLRSAKHVMRDHAFQLPTNRLDVLYPLAQEVVCGERKLEWSAACMRGLEFFEYPGDFAKLFDDVSTSGVDQKDAYNANLFEQQKQTARIRAEEQVVQSFNCGGSSDCIRFRPGYKFKLNGHDCADDDYLLTSVEHSIRMADFVASSHEVRAYSNRFTCVPRSLPYRPKRTTAEPIMHGSQTATVVGPPDEEIHVDKYGRIKVKFHWDSSDVQDGANSCWVRVASPWAGKGWGMVALPRVGQEVVVDFMDGDPDRPLVMSSVYNADQANTLEDVVANKKNMVIKSQTVGGSAKEYHGIFLNDEKDAQVLAMRSQRHFYQKAPNDMGIGSGRTLTVDAGRGMFENVGGFGFLAAATGLGAGSGSVPTPAGDRLAFRFGGDQGLPSQPGATGTGAGVNDGDSWVNHKSGATMTKILGVKWANVAGVDAKSVTGMQWSTLLGPKHDYAINPLGLIPLASAGPLTAAGAALGPLLAGKFAYLLGHSGELIRGSKMTVASGRTVTVEFPKIDGIWQNAAPTMVAKVNTEILARVAVAIGIVGTVQALLAGYFPPVKPLSDDPSNSQSKIDGYDLLSVIMQTCIATIQAILCGWTFGKSIQMFTSLPADQYKKITQAESDQLVRANRIAAWNDNDTWQVQGVTPPPPPPPLLPPAPLPAAPPAPAAAMAAAAGVPPLGASPPLPSGSLDSIASMGMLGDEPVNFLAARSRSVSYASLSAANCAVGAAAAMSLGRARSSTDAIAAQAGSAPSPIAAALSNVAGAAAASSSGQVSATATGGTGRGGSPLTDDARPNPYYDVRGGTYALVNAGTLIHASSKCSAKAAPASVACVATGKNATFLASASRAVQLLADDAKGSKSTGRSEIYLDNEAGILLAAKSKEGFGEIALSTGTKKDDDQQVMILGKTGTFIRCGKKGKGQRIIFTKKGIIIESTEQPISIKSKKGKIEIQTDGGDLSIDTKGGKATIDAGAGELALKGKGGVKLECGSSTVELSSGSIDMNSGAYNMK